jgi:hypothetical protein
MNTFIEHMAAAGFALPVELPDATFKEVAWMKGTDGPRAV